MGQIVSFSGASGAGKSTIIEGLLAKHPEWGFIQGHTTRQPREKDRPGRGVFYTQEAFLEAIAADKFLWYFEFFGNLYGLARKDINNALMGSNLTLLDRDHVGVQVLHYYLRLRNQQDSLKAFFIDVPLESDLRARMKDRGESPEKIARRISISKSWRTSAVLSSTPTFEFVANPKGSLEGVISKIESFLLSASP